MGRWHTEHYEDTRDYIVGGSLNLIKKDNPDYSDEKLEILEYGLTGLYIFISKSIVIFTIAYFLGILRIYFTVPVPQG